MPTEIFIAPEQHFDQQAITLAEVIKRRVQRRRRVAKRMLKRCPLFAVEFMQKEFPGYTLEDFEADVNRKTRKPKSKKKGKSPLKRQGRYPLYSKALAQYSITKDHKYLEEAQRWRDRLYLPFEVVFSLNGNRQVYTFPSTTSLRIIESLGKLKFSSWEELEEKKAQVLKYAHIN